MEPENFFLRMCCEILLVNFLLIACKVPTLNDVKLMRNGSERPSQTNQSTTDGRPSEDDGSVPGYNLVCGSTDASNNNSSPNTVNQTVNVGCRYQNTQTAQPADLNTIASVNNWSYSLSNRAITITTENPSMTTPSWHVIYHINYPANTTDFTFSQIQISFTYTENASHTQRAVSNNMQQLLARYNVFNFVESDLYSKTWLGDSCWYDHTSHSGGDLYSKWFLRFDHSANMWVKVTYFDNDTCMGDPISVDDYSSYPITLQGFNPYGALNVLTDAGSDNSSYDLIGISDGVLYHDVLDTDTERSNWAPLLKRPDTAYHVVQ